MQTKQLQNLLSKGNLTPREKFILLIQNDVQAHRTGKEVLTPGDKAALENWKAQTNAEAQEWNTYNEGWKYSGRMGIETELYFHDAQAAHLQVRPIIMELLKYPLHREIRLMVENIKDIKKVSAADAIAIIGKQKAVKLQEGMDFEYAVYQRAWERMGEADQKRLLDLYCDAKSDHQYLDQEEIIAHLLDGKERLTKAAKKKLAELIASRSYNAYAKEYQLYHYFACIPLAEVARYFLKDKGVSISGKQLAQNQEADDEDDVTHREIQKAVLQYAQKHDTTVEAILKEGFVRWYDAEGFAYTPLIVSDDKELFLRWLKSKAEARVELQGLVDSGALQVRLRAPRETHDEKLHSKGIYESELKLARKALEQVGLVNPEKGEMYEKRAFETFSDRVITGESLYAFAGDFAFVKDFKERADEYDPNLGLVYADDDPEHKGEHLDQELLVCPTTGESKEEFGFFSMFGFSMRRLELSLESIVFFKEEKEGGKTYLKFKNKEVEKMFRESRQSFIEGYAKVLALKVLTDKLSALYETDLSFRVNELIARLDKWMEGHNEALDVAQRPATYKRIEMNEDKIVSEIDSTLYIDKNTITPDLAVIEEHTKKLKEIFWDF